MLSNRPVTSLTFMGLIVAALGSHGQSSYQILTRPRDSPYQAAKVPPFDDPPVPAAGGRAAGFGLHRRRAALSDLRPPRPCHRLTRQASGPGSSLAQLRSHGPKNVLPVFANRQFSVRRFSDGAFRRRELLPRPGFRKPFCGTMLVSNMGASGCTKSALMRHYGSCRELAPPDALTQDRHPGSGSWLLISGLKPGAVSIDTDPLPRLLDKLIASRFPSRVPVSVPRFPSPIRCPGCWTN